MSRITVEQYAVGVLGFSLIRNWYKDAESNEDRVREMREVLDNADQFPWNIRLDPQEQDLIGGYAEWSHFYDGPNPLITTETAVSQPVLRRLATGAGRVLDAACGTGRHAQFLDSLGCDVVGIDQSREMLEVARGKLPSVRFELGSVENMPFDDNEFDLAVASLALCHLDDPTTALTELARVVRVGGHVVITDPHPSSELVGGQAFYGGIVEGQPMRWVRNHYHTASTWLRSFKVAGLTVDGCLEEPFGDDQIASFPVSIFYPDATLAALSGLPSLWLWELRATR
jgi:ubiquinone/menaquinone biosynthesis C-methylase UbiE